MPPGPSYETGNSSRKTQSHADREREIPDLADRQHGVVATWQLIRFGFTHDDIRYRARTGRLHRKHRGVYAVGHGKLTPNGHRMAAVLAYGPDAVLSHRSAAAQWGIGPGSWKIDVTTPRSRRSRQGIRCHTAALHPEDIATRNGIPLTSVARTILELASVLSQHGLTRLIEDAERAELIDLRALERAIARRPRAKGIRRLGAVLETYRGAADTRSQLERDFRALIVAAGLPEPQYNVVVAGLTVDVYWPEWKLVVELDGRRYHTSPHQFETDRLRDATLQKAGLRVLRVTGRRLNHAPVAVVDDILTLSRL